MWNIRPEQLASLEAAADEAALDRLVARLTGPYSGRLPVTPAAARAELAAWVADARAWGLRSEELIAHYVESCLRVRGRREPLVVRVATYLRLYRPVAGLDVEAVADEAVARARRGRVTTEEGVAWLAAILAAGRLSDRPDADWINDALAQEGDEEVRLRTAHRGAVQRGWFTEGSA